MLLSKSALVGLASAAIIFSAAHLAAQSTYSAAAAAPALEFPVLMRQKVEAGKTPVGTKIQAKLTVATLVNGIVIPQNAVLSGEVIESAVRSSTEPSRLAVCLDFAEWKNGSAPVTLGLTSKICLTAWFYALTTSPEDFPEPLPDAIRPTRRRGSAPLYSDPNTRDSPSNSRGNADKVKNQVPNTPSTTVSQHREMMKNVESTKGSSGGVVLSSTRSNVKLDTTTTYVFAAGDLGTGTGSRKP